MVEEGLLIIKDQDQTNLFLLDQHCSSTIEFLRAKIANSPTVEAAVQSAGPQDCVCTQRLDHSRESDNSMRGWIAELEIQQAHARDLQAEPYPEWDLTIPPPLSEAEMEKLELEVSGSREAIERDLPFYNKAVELMVSAGSLVQAGRVTEAEKFLKDGSRRLQEENMGAKDSPWDPANTIKARKSSGRAPEKKAEEEAAEEEAEESREFEDDWTDHSRLIEEDARR